jgi:DNA-binding HxlR family transcriptional regulator
VSALSANPDETVWRSGCPISSALDVLGDKWSLLIIRDLVICGTRTYSDFRESPEGIATNILAARLKLLSRLDLIERVDPERASRGNAYQLTERGAALRPTLNELFTWSQQHLGEFHPDMHPEQRSL